MTKQKKPYKSYTREFKQEAVRLFETTDLLLLEVAMEQGMQGSRGAGHGLPIERWRVSWLVVQPGADPS